MSKQYVSKGRKGSKTRLTRGKPNRHRIWRSGISPLWYPHDTTDKGFLGSRAAIVDGFLRRYWLQELWWSKVRRVVCPGFLFFFQDHAPVTKHSPTSPFLWKIIYVLTHPQTMHFYGSIYISLPLPTSIIYGSAAIYSDIVSLQNGRLTVRPSVHVISGKRQASAVPLATLGFLLFFLDPSTL